MERAQRQRSTASPPPHHLGRDPFLLFGVCRIRLHIPPERRHPLVQLAKNDVTSIAPEHIRLRDGWALTHFIRVTQNEFSGFQRAFVGIRTRNAASFDRGMTDSIPEAERLFITGESAAI